MNLRDLQDSTGAIPQVLLREILGTSVASLTVMRGVVANAIERSLLPDRGAAPLTNSSQEMRDFDTQLSVLRAGVLALERTPRVSAASRRDRVDDNGNQTKDGVGATSGTATADPTATPALPFPVRIKEAFGAGFYDGYIRELYKLAPETRGGELEIAYLKGYVAGADKRVRDKEIAPIPGNAAGCDPDIKLYAEILDNPGPNCLPAERAPARERDAGRSEMSAREFERALRIGYGNYSPPELDNEEGLVGAELIPEHGGEDTTFGLFLPLQHPPPHRRPRHVSPPPSYFFARAHPGLPRPDGVDRRSLAFGWDEAQRDALFEEGDSGFWMRLERLRDGTDLATAVAICKELSKLLCADEKPLEPVLPNVPQTAEPSLIYVRSTKAQAQRFVDGRAWSTPLGCVQTFPNADLPTLFAATFVGYRYAHADHARLREMAIKAINGDVRVRNVARAYGANVETLTETLELDFLIIQDGRQMMYLWNILIIPPTQELAGVEEWRATIRRVQIGDRRNGFLVPYDRLFQCGTCGCRRHPSTVCPTISCPNWMGFIPQLPDAIPVTTIPARH